MAGGFQQVTSGAHISHVMLALVRSEEGSERDARLSQFLIPMDAPGITIRPIIDMGGDHHFNEVFFDDVLLPEWALVGTRGQGWAQATAELALERVRGRSAPVEPCADDRADRRGGR